MKLTWLGHSGFRLEIDGEVLLIDPWLTGNPMFPQERRLEAISGAGHILVTHAHGDHAADVVALATETGAQVVCIHELGDYWQSEHCVKTLGMGKGGTVALGNVRVTMVNAVHSSSHDMHGGRPGYAGEPAGFMIAGEGRTIYVTGDTDIMADMDWMGELHKPDIGILCCGGHYTMDMDRAAWAAKRYFNFRTVVPCHYKTFGLLAQDAAPLVAALPNIDVRLPEVMEAMTL